MRHAFAKGDAKIITRQAQAELTIRAYVNSEEDTRVQTDSAFIRLDFHYARIFRFVQILG